MRHCAIALSGAHQKFTMDPRSSPEKVLTGHPVGSLRFHGGAFFAPHVPISSLLHNVGKFVNLAERGGFEPSVPVTQYAH